MTANGINIKIRRKLNQVGRDLGWKIGWGKNRLEHSSGSRILVYHGICLKDPFQFNTLFVALKTFEKQLQFYKKYFQIVSLDDYYQGNFSKDRYTIVLSFDDGFANNYKYVLPLLEKYQVPASFFITAIRESGYDFLWNDLLSIAGKYGPSECTFRDENFTRNRHGRYISNHSGLGMTDRLRLEGFEAKEEMMKYFERFFSLKKQVHEDYWKQMTVDEIRTMSESKWVTIGSHSYYHNDLANLSAEEIRDDLTRSRSFLENITGKEVRSLAFPYGSYSPQTIIEANMTGYTRLLATSFINNSDRTSPSLRERLTVNPFISPVNQMHASISGNYD